MMRHAKGPLQRVARALEARFSPEGWLALQLTFGLIVVFLGAIAFAAIARETAANEPFTLVDHRVVAWFHAHATPLRTGAARAISFLGSVRFLTVASVIVALVLWRKNMLNRLIVVTLAMAGGSVLNLALKHAFHRQRPVLENPLVTLSSYGFPSGHTMGSTIFYGLLALIVAALLRDWWHRVFVVLGAIVLIGLVALSRVYLGAHYVSDVSGAFAAGVAWLAFCWTGLVTIRRRRGSRSGR